MRPHCAPTSAHVRGVHDAHGPQSRMTPSSQPLPDGPHVTLSSVHVLGVHVPSGGPTHEARSNNMNSSVFSCAVIVPALHSFGNVEPPDEASDTWKSLYSTRPHCVVGAGSGAYAIGVSNV